MKQFSERNPVWLAIIGTLVLAALVVGTLSSASLPVIGDGESYTARFREAAGLSTRSEVRIAGVKVGRVNDIDLDGTHVVVRFSVKDAWLGDRTTAAIRLKTLLGQKYLSLEPEGEHRLREGGTIPLARTTVPYDVTAAMGDLAGTLDDIDVPQLAGSFRALSSAFAGTPRDVRRMLDGLSGVAATIAGRDAELARLMRSVREVSGITAGLGDQIERMLVDGDLLLTELDRRRDAMHRLLRGTRTLSRALHGIVADNAKQLAPALAKLDRVSAILQRNKVNLDRALSLLGPYYTLLTDASGTGPWVDAYVCGLFDEHGRPELDRDKTRTCDPQAGGGR